MDTSVTALASEKEQGALFFVGGQDGSVRAYDRRNPPQSSMVRLWDEHRTYLRGVHLQSSGNRELVSCSVDGSVRLWDLRLDGAINELTLNPQLRASVASFAVHDRAPLLAALGKPRASAMGRQSHISRLSLCTLDPLAPLGIPLQYPSSSLGQAPNAGLRTIGDARRAMADASLSGRAKEAFFPDPLTPDPRIVRYTPPPGAVAFHGQLHVLAYAGPGNSIKLNAPPLTGSEESAWNAHVYNPRPVRELIIPPASSQRAAPAPRGSWIW